MVKRTQALVLGFGLLAWIGLIVLLLTAPEVYDHALPATSHRRAADIAFLVVLSASSPCSRSVCLTRESGLAA